jgi:hypothetical protein
MLSPNDIPEQQQAAKNLPHIKEASRDMLNVWTSSSMEPNNDQLQPPADWIESHDDLSGKLFTEQVSPFTLKPDFIFIGAVLLMTHMNAAAECHAGPKVPGSAAHL